jgi:hypothetical protein
MGVVDIILNRTDIKLNGHPLQVAGANTNPNGFWGYPSALHFPTKYACK